MAVCWRIYSIVSAGVRGGWHAVLSGFPTWWLIANEVGTRLMLSAGILPVWDYVPGSVHEWASIPPDNGTRNEPGKVTNNSGDLGTIRVTPSHGGHDAEAMVAPP